MIWSVQVIRGVITSSKEACLLDGYYDMLKDLQAIA
jgi:hypothetical protein